MKYVRKITVLLTVLAMLVTLCACGGPSEKDFIGVYECEAIEVEGMMLKPSDIGLDIYVELEEDGEGVFVLDGDMDIEWSIEDEETLIFDADGDTIEVEYADDVLILDLEGHGTLWLVGDDGELPDDISEQVSGDGLSALLSGMMEAETAEEMPAAEVVEEEPAVEEPAVEEPVAEEPAAEEPAVEEPAEELPEETEEAPAEATDAMLELGQTENGVYANDFFKIGCTLDENWYYYSTEEIMEVNNMTDEALSEAGLEEYAEANNTYTDMYAQNIATSASVNVTVERLNLMNAVALTEEDYAEISLDGLKTALESSGLENVAFDVSTIDFAADQHTAITVSGDFSGTPFYEMIICVKQGNYMGVFTIASLDVNELSEIVNLFYPL